MGGRTRSPLKGTLLKWPWRMRAGFEGIFGLQAEGGEQVAFPATRQTTEITGLFPAFKPHFSFRRTEWWRWQSGENLSPNRGKTGKFD